MKILKGIEIKPYVVALYGPPGIGKSTLANGADKPVFLNFEDGIHHLDCSRTEVIQTSDSLKYTLGMLTHEFNDTFNTIVLDTIDALEDLLIKEICNAHGRESLAAFGYGQGYDTLNKKWTEILGWFSTISKKYKKNFILIGHDQIKRYDDPLGDGYDRIHLKMHHKSALTLVSKMDAVFYMCLDKVIRTTEAKKRKAVGTGKRIIYTEETPVFVAKNRYELEKKMEVEKDFFNELETKLYPVSDEPKLEMIKE